MQEFKYTYFPISYINEDIYIFKGKDKNGFSVLMKNDLKNGKQLELAEFDMGGKATKNMIVQRSAAVPVCINSNNVYYAKSDSCTIVKMNILGKVLNSFTIKDRKQKKITREEKIERIGAKIAKRLKGMTVAGKSALSAYLKAIPDKKPFYNKLIVNDKGLIYAFIPGKKNGLKIDVFSLEGRYLYETVLKLPDNVIIKKTPIFHKNFLYAFTEDEAGELKLIKYKVNIPKT